MLVGLNCDPGNFEDYDALARDLRAAGATVARFPLVDGREQLAHDFCVAIKDNGMEPLPVVVRESTQPGGLVSEYVVLRWCATLPDVQYWQIGNEADHQSPSSWTLGEDRFSMLLRNARQALGHDRYLIAGAMVSGHPEYLDGVDLGPVDAIAIHGYGQRPNGYRGEGWGFGWLRDLYARYERFGKPIWGTEYGGTVDVGSGQWKTEGIFDNQEDRADYYGRFLETLAACGAAAGLPFKFEDEGVLGYGMRGTPALEAFRQASTKMQASGTAKTNSRHENGLDEGGPVKIEALAAQHGGFYSPPVTLSTSKGKPTARIAWVNKPEHGFILEINGEADGPYRPLA